MREILRKILRNRIVSIIISKMYRINDFLVWLNQVKIISYIRYNRKVWLYRKAHLKLHRSCKLRINGRLSIGTPWEPIGDNFYTAFFDTHFVAYKNSTIEVGTNVLIRTGCLVRVQSNAKLIFGDNSRINFNGMIYCYDMVKIGNDVRIGPYVRIRDSDSHDFEYPGYNKPNTAPIIIEDHVWIALGVTILKGVTIGEGAVIAAGSVVNKSIPPHCLAGGNPAKVLRENVDWK